MMMVKAPFTAYHNTPNKSIRQPVARRGVILHHAAMTSLDGLRRLAMGAKQVSATAIVKDEQAERMMADGYRPWSVASAYWDSAMRSVETCNESTDGWTISDASHWTLARLVAYWAELDGFYPHRDGDPSAWTVIGHRELNAIHGASYPTACPGGMDLDLVTRRAQAILNGSSTAGGRPTTPIRTESEEDEHMQHLYVRDKGGTADLWTLANTATGEIVQTRDGNLANTWAEAWGNAKVCTLDAFLNALHAVELTTAPNGEALERLQAAIEDIRAQLPAAGSA